MVVIGRPALIQDWISVTSQGLALARGNEISNLQTTQNTLIMSVTSIRSSSRLATAIGSLVDADVVLVVLGYGG